MKITIQSTTEKEIEFPTPSFWKHYGCFYMVADGKIITTYDEAVFINSRPESENFKNRIFQILADDYTQIQEEEFFEQLEKALKVINESVKVPA